MINTMKMKKLKYFLVAAMLPFLMTSCWEEPEQTDSDPIYAGIWLYNTAVVQSTYAIDPAAIAFRLNCLLTDKQLQGVDRLDDVLTEAEAHEKKFLFGEITRIEENYNGVAGDFHLTFDISTDRGQSDRARGGSILISTGNQLLSDLAESGDAWVIEVDKNLPLNYQISDAEQVTFEGADTYTISAQAQENGYICYTVTIEGYKCKSHLGVYTSSWRGYYAITPQTDQKLSMSVVRKTEFKVATTMTGPTFAALDGVNQTNLVYQTTEENIYVPDCAMSSGNVYRKSGEEMVSIYGTYDTETFPSSFATVRFTPSGSECGSVSAKITYNGEVYTLNAN